MRATDGGLAVSTSNGHTNQYLRVLGRDVASVDNIQGLTLAGAFIDEAPLQPEDFIQELSFRCSVPGSRLVMVCNPAGGKRQRKSVAVIMLLAVVEQTINRCFRLAASNDAVTND